jgi:hypothetical protein
MLQSRAYCGFPCLPWWHTQVDLRSVTSRNAASAIEISMEFGLQLPTLNETANMITLPLDQTRTTTDPEASS